MRKTILIVLGVATVGIFLVAVAGMYKFNYLASQPEHDVDGNRGPSFDLKNTTYSIDGTLVTLLDGSSEEGIPGSTQKTVTNYFGNEVRTDLNNDGREDIVFLLTQNTGGTGTFFYVVAALNTEEGFKGSEGFFLGDRIAPQTTEISEDPGHQNVIIVNYMDRDEKQPMSEEPSVGKSIWLKLDTETLQFGEVVRDFEGEANPEIMTLDMKSWKWVKTAYNNDIEIVPREENAFVLSFMKDGAVSIATDCNAMGGSYQVGGNNITFGSMTSTEMYCEGSQEQEFSKMLGEVESFFFTEKGELVFDLKFDSGTSIFR